jgi:hypothetical protein
LALQLNNLPAAADAAAILNDSATWQQLAAQALLAGDVTMAETAYQRARAYNQA